MFNNLESFLDQIISSAAGDSHVTSDGNGNITVLSIKLTKGSMTRVSVFTGNATNTGNLQAHGLGATPDWVGIQENGTTSDSNNFVWDKTGTDATNIKVWSNNASSRSYTAIAIKL